MLSFLAAGFPAYAVATEMEKAASEEVVGGRNATSSG